MASVGSGSCSWSGRVLAYMGFGTIWLWERGWLWFAAMAWIAAGGLFSVLAALWTKNVEPIMPPLDWDSPGTFSPRDREAWKIVEAEADAGESLPMESLIEADLYIETGRELLTRLAEFYHPNRPTRSTRSRSIELLTAMELAAEDLRSAFAPGARRRHDHAVALAAGDPGGRIHLQGQRHLFAWSRRSSTR